MLYEVITGHHHMAAGTDHVRGLRLMRIEFADALHGQQIADGCRPRPPVRGMRRLRPGDDAEAPRDPLERDVGGEVGPRDNEQENQGGHDARLAGPARVAGLPCANGHRAVVARNNFV